ncbi:hypothetical protein LX64_01655 [Chitinophaga skermanii]|uniref:ThuA-like domain-containing protein n=1 Tax=Chitinophaga skermanii TaxID=331697 RepID=A0A327QR65_9BACT|nr:ThuA domain-containing protein [Chitinophaga skermanii]RAJ06528.1 hypothetical protein LX64_01655 [Chitinophaga skermanii]
MLKKTVVFICLVLLGCTQFSFAQKSKTPVVKALVLYENGGHHLAFSKRAKLWLDSIAQKEHWQLDYFTNTDAINDSSLAKYNLFIQLDYPPYTWKPAAVSAFVDYIDKGKGGWIGLHHATLLGEFDGYAMWPWFHEFMGSIKFKDYIPGFAAGKVVVEKSNHPVMKNLPATFVMENEEWYTYDRSPRPNVEVLAHVDEKSYTPPSTKTMGDHPVIWSNPSKAARNVYIFMGHSPKHFDNAAYTQLLYNAIHWASGQKK